jgi:hypothetical protein
MATGSDRRSSDALGVPLGVGMPNRKLRNIRLIGAFSPKWRYKTSPVVTFGVPLGAL